MQTNVPSGRLIYNYCMCTRHMSDVCLLEVTLGTLWYTCNRDLLNLYYAMNCLCMYWMSIISINVHHLVSVRNDPLQQKYLIMSHVPSTSWPSKTFMCLSWTFGPQHWDQNDRTTEMSTKYRLKCLPSLVNCNLDQRKSVVTSDLKDATERMCPGSCKMRWLNQTKPTTTLSSSKFE